MVLTPQEAGKLTEEELKEAGYLEKRIDTHLKEYYIPRSGSNPSINIFHIIKKTSERALYAVIEAYKEAGWNVEYYTNQHNSEFNCLRLTPKPRKRLLIRYFRKC
jgi:hypothetical protein